MLSAIIVINQRSETINFSSFLTNHIVQNLNTEFIAFFSLEPLTYLVILRSILARSQKVYYKKKLSNFEIQILS